MVEGWGAGGWSGERGGWRIQWAEWEVRERDQLLPCRFPEIKVLGHMG